MKGKIIEYAVEVIKNLTSLSKTVVEEGRPDKFANSIETMSKNVEVTYDQMRQLIMADTELNTDEKLRRLDVVAQSQQKARERCEESIKGNRENVSKVALEIVKGFFTCGISFIPSIIAELKNVLTDKEDVKQLENLTRKNDGSL